MARLVTVFFSLVLVFLFVDLIVSADPPAFAPGPAIADSPISQSPSPDSGAPASAPSIPSPSPDPISPPAPPPSYHAAPGSSPTPTPNPSPSDASDINHASTHTEDEETKSSPSGLNGGQKAGIVALSIVAVGIVGLLLLVYKKRQDNIRRSQYGSATRRAFL